MCLIVEERIGILLKGGMDLVDSAEGGVGGGGGGAMDLVDMHQSITELEGRIGTSQVLLKQCRHTFHYVFIAWICSCFSVLLRSHPMDMFRLSQ